MLRSSTFKLIGPKLLGSHTTCRLSFDAAFRDPLVPWSLDDGISDPLPKLPLSSRSHRLTSGTAKTQYPPRILSLASPPDPLPDISSAPVPSLTRPPYPSVRIALALPLSSPSIFSTSHDTISLVQGTVPESHHESHPLSLSLNFRASGPFIFTLTLYFNFGTEEPHLRERKQLPGKSSDEPSAANEPVLATLCDQSSMILTIAPGVLLEPLFVAVLWVLSLGARMHVSRVYMVIIL